MIEAQQLGIAQIAMHSNDARASSACEGPASARDWKYFPDKLGFTSDLVFLEERDRRLLSRIQARTFLNFAIAAERFVLRQPLRHPDMQWIARRMSGLHCIERDISRGLPPGYRFLPAALLFDERMRHASCWTILALCCHLSLLAGEHRKTAADELGRLNPSFRRLFDDHAKQQVASSACYGLEWLREHATLDVPGVQAAVAEYLAVLHALDELVRGQAERDYRYFLRICGSGIGAEKQRALAAVLVQACRYQAIGAGLGSSEWMLLLSRFLPAAELERFRSATCG